MKKKKLIYVMKVINFIALFFLMLFSANSCKKNEEIINQDPDSVGSAQFRDHITTGMDNLEIKQTNGRLLFQNEQHFEFVMKDLMNKSDQELTVWENDHQFYSMRKHFEINGMVETIPIDAPEFAAVLNPDGIFQAGNRVFNIDKDNELVYVMLWKNEQDEELVVKLKEKQEIASKIVAVSTETDVAWHVDPHSPAPKVKCTENCYVFDEDAWLLKAIGGSCNEGQNDALDYYTHNDKEYQVDATICYNNWGAYCKLHAKTMHYVEQDNKQGWNREATAMRFVNVVWTYKKRCKEEKSAGSGTTSTEFDSKIYYNIYAGTRCLTRFRVTQTTEGKRKDGTTFTVTALWNTY